MAATEKHSSAPQRGRHLCHLTSALSLQQDSVRLRRCGSRRHLRGRIALQANLSLQPTNPGLQPEVTHSIAFQAKIVLLPTGWKANFNWVRSWFFLGALLVLTRCAPSFNWVRSQQEMFLH